MHMEFLFCENSKTSPLLNGADHWLPQMVGPRKRQTGSRNKEITLLSLNNSHTDSTAINSISPILARQVKTAEKLTVS